MGEKTKNKLPRINLSHETEDSSNIELEDFRKNFKRKRSWSPEEVNALQAGVEEFGMKWKRILKRHRKIFFHDRRIVDLATKYRLLNKQSSYYNASARDWIQLDDNEEPLKDWDGEILAITQRFPYDAALLFAKRRVWSGERKFSLVIREAQDIQNVHRYTIDVDVNTRKISMKKQTRKR